MSKKKLSNLSKALLGMSAGMRRAGIMDAPTHERIVQRISKKPLKNWPSRVARRNEATHDAH